MSEFGDLEELETLGPARVEGSAKRIRSGRRRMKAVIERSWKRPLWKKQLSVHNQVQRRTAKP